MCVCACVLCACVCVVCVCVCVLGGWGGARFVLYVSVAGEDHPGKLVETMPEAQMSEATKALILWQNALDFLGVKAERFTPPEEEEEKEEKEEEDEDADAEASTEISRLPLAHSGSISEATPSRAAPSPYAPADGDAEALQLSHATGNLALSSSQQHQWQQH